MLKKKSLLDRLSDWLADSITHRVRFYSLALTGGATALVGLISYFTLGAAIEQNEQQRISHQSSLVNTAFSFYLDSIAQESKDLARNALVANGLVDSMGKEAYLIPFLRDHRSVADIPIDLVLLDFQGKPVAANKETFMQEFPKLEEIASVLNNGAPIFKVIGTGSEYKMVMVIPIVFPPTRHTEGALLVEYDLHQLFRMSIRNLEKGLYATLAMQGNVLISSREVDKQKDFKQGHARRMPAYPLDRQDFDLRVQQENMDYFTPVRILAVTHLLSSLLALIVVYFIVSRITRHLTLPIIRLSETASRIAERGEFHAEVPISTHDELGKLTASFNLMLKNLRSSQDSLELRVEERTQQLRDSEQFNRSILNAAIDGFFLIDEHGCLIDANPSFCELLGYSRRELAAMNISELECKDLLPHQRIEFSRIADIFSEVFETCYLARTGEFIEAEVSVKYLPDSRKMFGFVRDISERKRAELTRFLQAEEQRNALVREVHHRIKNNLQGMIGLLSLQAEQSPEVASAIESIIGKIKSVAVVFGLQGQRNEENVYLLDVLRELCDAARLISLAEIRLQADSPGLERVELHKDKAVAIALVVNELITNAIKHNHDNQEAIRISLAPIEFGVVLEIVNPCNRIAEEFDYATNSGLGTGLTLVRFMLPREGAQLVLKAGNGKMYAELRLSEPVILSPKRG